MGRGRLVVVFNRQRLLGVPGACKVARRGHGNSNEAHVPKSSHMLRGPHVLLLWLQTKRCFVPFHLPRNRFG